MEGVRAEGVMLWGIQGWTKSETRGKGKRRQRIEREWSITEKILTISCQIIMNLEECTRADRPHIASRHQNQEGSLPQKGARSEIQPQNQQWQNRLW